MSPSNNPVFEVYGGDISWSDSNRYYPVYRKVFASKDSKDLTILVDFEILSQVTQ